MKKAVFPHVSAKCESRLLDSKGDSTSFHLKVQAGRPMGWTSNRGWSTLKSEAGAPKGDGEQPGAQKGQEPLHIRFPFACHWEMEPVNYRHVRSSPSECESYASQSIDRGSPVASCVPVTAMFLFPLN